MEDPNGIKAHENAAIEGAKEDAKDASAATTTSTSDSNPEESKKTK